MDAEFPGNGSSRGNGARVSRQGTLARRADFRLGSATIRPSLRTVEGPKGRLVAEPRVMQVLVALADARGAVLSRDELMRQCWTGAIVGDDAVTRTIAEIRRIARQAEAGFDVETIPRVGYRLTGGLPAAIDTSSAPASEPADEVTPDGHTPAWTTRRAIIGGAVVATVAAGLLGARWMRPRPDPRFEDLVGQGLQALRDEWPGGGNQGVEQFKEAVRLQPTNARALGLLALAHAYEAEFNVEDAVKESESTAGHALRLHPGEPHASVALALVRRRRESWSGTERQLREVLNGDPHNRWALNQLMLLLQAAGYNGESRDLNDRVVELDKQANQPNPGPLSRQALKFWIAGDEDKAVQIAEYARDFNSRHPVVWKALMLVYAFTRRFDAARQQLETQFAADQLDPDGVLIWQDTLGALEHPSRENSEKVRDAFLQTDRSRYLLMMHGILFLSQLREVEAAYRLFDGMVLSRGDQVVSNQAQDPQWRKTLWLFTPAMRPFRADPRILDRTRSLGLDAYWDERGDPDEGRRYTLPLNHT